MNCYHNTGIYVQDNVAFCTTCREPLQNNIKYYDQAFIPLNGPAIYTTLSRYPIEYKPDNLRNSEWNAAITATIQTLEKYREMLRGGGSGQSYTDCCIAEIRQLLKHEK